MSRLLEAHTTVAASPFERTYGKSSSSSDEITIASLGVFLWSRVSSAEDSLLAVDVMLCNSTSVRQISNYLHLKVGTYDHALSGGKACGLLAGFRAQGDEVGVQV